MPVAIEAKQLPAMYVYEIFYFQTTILITNNFLCLTNRPNMDYYFPKQINDKLQYTFQQNIGARVLGNH